jgi:phage portal protein BeeE
MSEEVNTETTLESNNEESVENGSSESTAREVDWVREARKWENLAKKNLAEAKSNAEAAKKLAEIEEASKTEAEKAAERLAEAEAKAQELESKVNRANVANQYNIPVHVLEGPRSSSVEDIEEFAKTLIDFRGEKDPNPIVPAEGKTPPPALNGGGIEDSLRNALGIR